MEIEQIFAARVLRAAHDAAVAAAHGISQTSADVIESALAELHACSSALGYARDEVQQMVYRHVEWIGGVPVGRQIGQNVSVFARKK